MFVGGGGVTPLTKSSPSRRREQSVAVFTSFFGVNFPVRPANKLSLRNVGKRSGGEISMLIRVSIPGYRKVKEDDDAYTVS